MANDEHVAMLKKGVDAWNECWRLENFDMRPNLMRADLTGANLRGRISAMGNGENCISSTVWRFLLRADEVIK